MKLGSLQNVNVRFLFSLKIKKLDTNYKHSDDISFKTTTESASKNLGSTCKRSTYFSCRKNVNVTMTFLKCFRGAERFLSPAELLFRQPSKGKNYLNS